MAPRNAAADATPPRSRRPEVTVWSPEQMRTFLAHVRGDRFFALWMLASTTGMRRGELAGLLSTDIDFEHATITPSHPRVSVDGRVDESETKTNAGRRVMALDPATLKALRAYLEVWAEERELLGQKSKLLFVWANGTPLHPDTLTALFHKHAAAAGLPRVRLHDVRHSYATAALKRGIPPKVISERLGHTDVAFTLNTYTHVIRGMDQAAANEIADLILGPAEPDDVAEPTDTAADTADTVEDSRDADRDAEEEE